MSYRNLTIVLVLTACGPEAEPPSREARVDAADARASPALAASGRYANLRPDRPPPAIALPTPSGPHAVGTLTYHWIDPERRDAFSAPEADHRQVIAQLWYPAEADDTASRIAYMPELDAFRAGLMTLGEGRPTEDANRFATLDGVVVPAGHGLRFAGGAGPAPVVVFSPGGNMSRHWHSGLALELASHGYAVAVISHKHSTWDPFPAGGFALSRDWSDVPADTTYREDEVEITATMGADVRLVLDELAELGASDREGPFAGKLDVARAAVLGHSRGGNAVARACSTDPRVLACVIFDNIGPDEERESGLAKPQLAIRSDDPDAWGPERVESLRDFLERNSTGSWEAVLEGADHFSFTDLPLVDPDGFPSDLPASDAHRRVAALTLDFLALWLRGAEARYFGSQADTLAGVQLRMVR